MQYIRIEDKNKVCICIDSGRIFYLLAGSCCAPRSKKTPAPTMYETIVLHFFYADILKC